MKFVDPDGNGVWFYIAYVAAPVISAWGYALMSDVTTPDDINELTTSFQDGNYGEAAFAGGMAAFPWLTVKGGKVILKALEELPVKKLQTQLKSVGEALPKGTLSKEELSKQIKKSQKKTRKEALKAETSIKKDKSNKKGNEFRGGKKSVRDKWFGNTDTKFHKWWEAYKRWETCNLGFMGNKRWC